MAAGVCVCVCVSIVRVQQEFAERGRRAKQRTAAGEASPNMREVGINSGVELVERACAAGEGCAAPERGEVSAWVCGLCVAACALPVVTIFNVNFGFPFAISMCDLFFFCILFFLFLAPASLSLLSFNNFSLGIR